MFVKSSPSTFLPRGYDMIRRGIVVIAAVVLAIGIASLSADSANAGKYFVKASGGPGPGSPAEALELLSGIIIPTFDILIKWEKEGKITGGLPAGGRAFYMIVEADSNHELDTMLRSLPAWPVLQWHTTPLESFSARADTERKVVEELKKMGQ
jgi:hypothetical protein